MKADFLTSKHDAGRPYDAYVQTGTKEQQENWSRIYKQAHLTDAQKQLVGSFIRPMKVIVLSGIWCGDCVQQCPLLARIAEANKEKIDLRFLDRDEHMDLQDQVTINGGNRVPVALFCAEDGPLVGWFGDRTLRRYRALAAKQLGAACPLPGAPVDENEMADTLADWVDQFERAHLVLRLSTRLRKKYGD